MRKAGFISFCFICLLSSCVKPPSYPIEPHIEFKSVSSNYMRAGYVDTITFSFTDGDGDIGVNSSDSNTCDFCNALKHGDSSCLRLSNFNVFLIDSRDTCVSTFASANVQPTGKYKGISGDIEVIQAIDSKSCFTVPDPNCKLDTVVYSILLRDMAGHFSNIVKSVPIIVDPH